MKKKKSLLKKNGFLFRDIKKGQFSRSQVERRVANVLKKKSSALILKPEALTKNEILRLKRSFLKLGIKADVANDMLEIAKSNYTFYSEKLDDKEWEYSYKQTARKAKQGLIIAWTNKLSSVTLEEFVQLYAGRKAKWGISSAKHPRSEHIALYGEEFVVGIGLLSAEFSKRDLAIDLGCKGLHPGQEYGCQCEMILTPL